MGFGKPKYSGQTFKKALRLNNNAPIIARIVPPVKSCEATGEWRKYAGKHFGYKGVNRKDRSKPLMRTFECILDKDFRSGFVKQDCPECDLIEQHEAELKETIKSLEAQGRDKKEIEELTAVQAEWLNDHNCDRKWSMNVMLPDGTFNLLEISHKTMKILEGEIGRIKAEDGIDPIDGSEGVWFEFKRTGEKLAAVDTITVVYETVKDPTTGKNARLLKPAAFTLALEEKALAECQDLALLNTKLSYDQIRLLTECSGEDEEVDRIFALGAKKEASPAPSAAAKSIPSALAAPRPETQRSATPPPAAVVAPAPAPAVVPAAVAPAAAGETLQEQINRLTAELAAKNAAATAAAVAAPAPAEPEAAPEAAPAAQTVPSTPAATPAPGVPLDRAAFMKRFASKSA